MATQTKLSRKILARISDFDANRIDLTGHTWTLYSDGHLSAEYHSRWQGSHTGARYVTDAGYLDVDAINPMDPDTDAEAALTAEVEQIVKDGIDISESGAWRQTRRGVVVR
jgi:hypothetical protein